MFKGDYAKFMRSRSKSQVIGKRNQQAFHQVGTIISQDLDTPCLIIAGHSGNGKNSLSRWGGAYCCCPNRDEVAIEPCGTCAVCEAVFTNGDIWGANPWPDGMYFELAFGEGFLQDYRTTLDRVPGHRERYRGRRSIAVIDEAHNLNITAQTKLLKDAEDGIPYCYLVFVTSELSQLIAPLRNRSQIFTVHPPDEDDLVTFFLAAADKGQVPFKPGVEEVFARVLFDERVQQRYPLSFRSAANVFSKAVLCIEADELFDGSTLKRALDGFMA